jgi:hypothetical protein
MVALVDHYETDPVGRKRTEVGRGTAEYLGGPDETLPSWAR